MQHNPPKSRRGRPATGSVDWRKNPETGRMQWFVRVSVKSGRIPVPLDPAIPFEDKERARACGRLVRAPRVRDGA